MTALAFAMAVMQELPALIGAGQNVLDLLSQTSTALAAMQAAHRDPTQAEWDTLNGAIAGLKAAIDQAASV
ncbi:MAG: hypothetical protein KGJ41_02660 [Rhodospirillales bacterium]|nr:hypothetical protein [Rhodospirillales bacterium]MDE2197898.1 hypothetical protein [Rhodospirillales bacterium]MDE2575534.1 hypothetical protein [Rhodospirillales bacterium]